MVRNIISLLVLLGLSLQAAEPPSAPLRYTADPPAAAVATVTSRQTMLQAARQQRTALFAMVESSLARQRAAAQAQVESARLFRVPAPVSAAVVTAKCDPIPDAQIGPMIQAAARKEGLKVDLLRAVIEQESAFRPCAVSPKGAMGLMQLMPATASRFGVGDPFEPKQNIGAGARFLKELLTRYGGNVALALGAYNAGPATVDSIGRVPSIPETLQYVRAILAKPLAE